MSSAFSARRATPMDRTPGKEGGGGGRGKGEGSNLLVIQNNIIYTNN